MMIYYELQAQMGNRLYLVGLRGPHNHYLKPKDHESCEDDECFPSGTRRLALFAECHIQKHSALCIS
jgi:hypothetical protein